MQTMAPPAFWWVSPLVIGVGVLGSLAVAYVTIKTNRQIARTKATLDLIEAAESQEYYVTLHRIFTRFRKEAEFRAAILEPRTEEDRTARLRCWDFLNHYELISIGFDEGILDERFYRRWMGYAVLRDYREARDLIIAARAPPSPGVPGDEEAYVELEALCVKWGADPVSGARRVSPYLSRGT